MLDAIQAMKSRVSIRAYKPLPVPREMLVDIVDCGRLAPNGYNHQAWIFVVVTDQQVRRRIADAAHYGSFIRDAGACIAVFCKIGVETMVEDACAATENMIIAAQAYGLGTCWVNAYKKAHSTSVKDILNYPGDYELVTLFALGYPDEIKKTPKKPLDDLIRWNSF